MARDTMLKPLTGSDSRKRLLRRGLHAWFLLSRGMTLGVRAVILDGENRVCLIRHTYAPGWQFPGGGIDLGEDAVTALRREIREETEIEIGGQPVLHGVFLNRHVSRRDHVLVYVVRDFAVLAPKIPDREIAEATFWPVDALPADTTRGTRARLAEIGSSGSLDPFW